MADMGNQTFAWEMTAPPPDAVIVCERNGQRFTCKAKDLAPEFNIAGISWHFSGIAKESGIDAYFESNHNMWVASLKGLLGPTSQGFSSPLGSSEGQMLAEYHPNSFSING